MPPSAEEPVLFRELTSADYTAALDLWNRCEGVRANESPEEFARILARNPGCCSAAEAGGTLIGAVLGCHDGRRGYLYHLGVAANWRRHGIGQKLVQQSLAQIAAAGIARTTIFLVADNDAGEKFWRRIGWRLRTDLKVMAIDLA